MFLKRLSPYRKSNIKSTKHTASAVYDKEKNQFDLSQLAKYDRSTPTSKMKFSDRDYCLTDPDKQKNGGRQPCYVKLGKLYVYYLPEGKEGFHVTVWRINKKEKNLSKLLDFDNPRYPNIKFEDLMPFDAEALYPFRTKIWAEPKPKSSPNQLEHYQGLLKSKLPEVTETLKNAFTDLALGHEPENLQALIEQFNREVEPLKRQMSVEDTPSQRRLSF